MTNVNTIDITPIIEAVIAVIGVVITVAVIPWIKSKLNATQWNNLNEYAMVFVQTAEMLFKGTSLGRDKKKWVIEKLTAIAEEHNLKFSTDAIEAAIENAVKNMNDNKVEVMELETVNLDKPEVSE